MYEFIVILYSFQFSELLLGIVHGISSEMTIVFNKEQFFFLKWRQNWKLWNEESHGWIPCEIAIPMLRYTYDFPYLDWISDGEGEKGNDVCQLRVW